MRSEPDLRTFSTPTAARFAALDALRGVAALIVAAHHLHRQGPIFGSAFVQRGGLLVDFFFVLSGFVLAAAYGERLRAGFPALRFLWVRLGRIWPVHALMLLSVNLSICWSRRCCSRPSCHRRLTPGWCRAGRLASKSCCTC